MMDQDVEMTSDEPFEAQPLAQAMDVTPRHTGRQESIAALCNRLSDPNGTASSAARHRAILRQQKDRNAWVRNPPVNATPRSATRARRVPRKPVRSNFDSTSASEGSLHGPVCSRGGNKAEVGNDSEVVFQVAVHGDADPQSPERSGTAAKQAASTFWRILGLDKGSPEMALSANEFDVMIDIMKKMEEDNNKLIENNSILETQIQQIQNTSFRAISKSSWTLLDDKVIDTILTEIHLDLDEWCDYNCVEDIESLLKLPQEMLDDVVYEIRNVAYAPMDVEGQIKWWSTVWWTKNDSGTAHDPSRFLKAVLANTMYRHFSANPFSILDALQLRRHRSAERSEAKDGHRRDEEHLEEELGVERPSDGFLEVYKTLQRLCMPKKAAKFRCDILRSFIQSPETGNRFNEVKFASGVEGSCADFLAQVCPDLASRAVSEIAAPLIKQPLPPEALSELADIWTRAAHLFIQLHTQMAEIQVINPARVVGKHFSEEWMTRHQCHPRGTESYTEVHLVLTPMIRLSGNEDGDGYLQGRVLSKGTVLVGPELKIVTGNKGEEKQ